MSHTNHTTNYNLPQFIGSDKASWLGDLNPAFEAIDANLHAIDVVANDADSKAVAAQSSANNAIELGQTAIANTSDLSEKLKTATSKVQFTTTLKDGFTFTTYVTYNKFIGIIHINCNLGFDPQHIQSGAVIGSLGNLLKNTYTTNIPTECLVYLGDGSQKFVTMNISNNIITVSSNINENCGGIAYNTTIMVDPSYFN